MLEVLVFKKYQFIFMSHVLINYYKPKINTDKVEFNLIDIWTRHQAVEFVVVAVVSDRSFPKLLLATTRTLAPWCWV